MNGVTCRYCGNHYNFGPKPVPKDFQCICQRPAQERKAQELRFVEMLEAKIAKGEYVSQFHRELIVKIKAKWSTGGES